MQNQTFISILSVLIAATGISLVFKDYLASLLGGIILRRIRQVKPGARIKVLITPAITVKGDVISPLIIYGERITDEVIAYERPPFAHLDSVEEDMRAAISKEGHEVIEVGFYQREDSLIIHGIFTVHTQEAGDVRGRILKAFLERRHSRAIAAEASKPAEAH